MLLCCLWVGSAWPAEPPERAVEFDIRAQPLGDALRRFADQSGLQVLSSDLPLAGRQVPRVRGRMTPTAALRRLLADSGLSFRRIDAGTIAVIPAAPAVAARESRAADDASAVMPGAAADDISLLEEIEEVHVTGTRIRVPGTYTAANPMVTITGEEMRQLGIVNVADLLTTLVPQNIPSYQPLLTGDDQDRTLERASFFIGNTQGTARRVHCFGAACDV
jgi:hypothetical protein